MHTDKNKLLITASVLTGLVALAHFGCVVFGGDWYRFLGAGEQMAKMAEAGYWYPTLVTLFLVVMLTIWSLYALSGAQVIFRLPFLRLGLVIIASVYIIRGVAFVGLMPAFPDNSLMFWFISSGISLTIGMLYAIGTFQSWAELSLKNVKVPSK